MEHLLQKSNYMYSIFHNIFKYMMCQRRQKALLWSKGLNVYILLQTVINSDEIWQNAAIQQDLHCLLIKTKSIFREL